MAFTSDANYNLLTPPLRLTPSGWQTQLGGRVIDPTQATPAAPPPPPTTLTQALASPQPSEQSQPPANIAPLPPVDDSLSKALMAEGNSGQPIHSPLELIGRLAQVWSGNAGEAAAQKKQATADQSRRLAIAQAVEAAGSDPAQLQALAIQSGDPTVLAAATRANTPNYQTLNGRIYNIQAGKATDITPANAPPASRPFTDQDRSTFGIPPDQAGYMDATGMPHYLGNSTFAQTQAAVDNVAAPIEPTDPDYTTKPIAGGLTQAAIDQRALTALATGQTPPQGRTGIAGEQNVAISNRMATFGGNPALNKADYKALSASLSDQTEYKNTVQRAFATAEATLGTVTEWMQKNNINPSDYPDFNSLINFASVHGLDVGPIRGFQSQVAQLRAEYSMVLARGGQITDSTRAQANSIIPDNVTPADLQTIASRLNVDGQKALDASTQQIDMIHKQLSGIVPNSGGAAPPAAAATPATPPTAPPTTAPPAAATVPTEGSTATGPNGQRIILKNGQWVPLQ